MEKLVKPVDHEAFYSAKQIKSKYKSEDKIIYMRRRFKNFIASHGDGFKIWWSAKSASERANFIFGIYPTIINSQKDPFLTEGDQTQKHYIVTNKFKQYLCLVPATRCHLAEHLFEELQFLVDNHFYEWFTSIVIKMRNTCFMGVRPDAHKLPNLVGFEFHSLLPYIYSPGEKERHQKELALANKPNKLYMVGGPHEVGGFIEVADPGEVFGGERGKTMMDAFSNGFISTEYEAKVIISAIEYHMVILSALVMHYEDSILNDADAEMTKCAFAPCPDYNYGIYYILYTIYYVLYTMYYILYTIYYIVYTIHYTCTSTGLLHMSFGRPPPRLDRSSVSSCSVGMNKEIEKQWEV